MKLPEELTRKYRQEFNEIASGQPAPPPAVHDIAPLRSILLIGAVLEKENLSAMDSLFLSMFLYACCHHNIAVAPDFDLQLVNLDPAQGGEDFLTGDYKADGLISCFLYNAAPFGHCGFSNRHLTSARSHVPGIWHDKAEQTGARLICVFGDTETEITSAHYEGPSFRSVQSKRPGAGQGTLLVKKDFLPFINA